MDNLFVIIIVISIAIICGIILQGRRIKDKNINFKMLVQKTFPKYIVREKNNQIMICEYNHRNEPDELIFIRIGQRKNIKKSGRMIIINYPIQPTSKELKNDLEKYLK